MNEFRTVVTIPEFSSKISYNSTLLFMGSCFSENIGERFVERNFKALVNPFGILYNPVSVKQSIDILLEEKLFDETMLFEYKGLWHSFYHHSRFSSDDKQKILDNINDRIISGRKFLAVADFLFITFGTSWVYEHVDKKFVVANCHKLPASVFDRFRLTVDDTVESYGKLIARLKDLIPKLKIIFTVSPVRHWKDGAHGNQLSKSVLLLTIDALVNRFDDVIYFPAYEFVMDDLRDYRFYSDDMLHPNSQAVGYIWDRLKEVFFDEKAVSFISDMEKVIRAKNHKPFNPESGKYKSFLKKEMAKLEGLKSKYPGIDFQKDIQTLNFMSS